MTKKTTREVTGYGIHARYYYYEGTFNCPEDGPVMDRWDDSRRVRFANREQALSYIKDELGADEYDGNGRYSQSGTYYANHGEYQRPDFKVVPLYTR